MSTRVNKDYYGGALMLLLGLGAAFQGSQYPIGTLRRMGPGFFPTSLGVILALIGFAIAISARWEPPAAPATRHPPQWRGWFCICASIVAFVVVGRYGGLLPATVAIVFVSALGDRRNTVLTAGLLACAVSAVCVAVFWWALQLQFPLLAWR